MTRMSSAVAVKVRICLHELIIDCEKSERCSRHVDTRTTWNVAYSLALRRSTTYAIVRFAIV